jgi:hypothetical protein
MPTKFQRAVLLNTASAFGLALLLAFATGSGGKGGTTSDADASATPTSSDPSAPSEQKVSVSGKVPPNFEAIRGTCDKPKLGQCDEFYGLIPKFSPDSCKDAGGTFTTSTPSPHPCPKANLIGTCHYEQSKAGEPGQYANYYANHAQGAAALKADCIEPTGSKKEWIDAPAPAASASAPAKSASTPVGKAAAPGGKAAGSAKPKSK